MEAVDVTDIRQNNRRAIINALRFKEVGLTKREIADETQLSFATVSNLCNEMLKAGLLSAVKARELTVGRNPYLLVLNHDKFLTVCINLQMQAVMGLALLNLKKEIVLYESINIPDLTDPYEVIIKAKEVFDSDFRNYYSNAVLIGVGVAVSSIFDTSTEKLVNSAVPMFDGFAVKDAVEKVFHLNSYIDNEANLCAIGMKRNLDSSDNLIYVHVSEGLGVGIIAEGRLLRGAHGYGGEVAYIPIGNKDKYCSRSNSYGCIENDVSIPGIIRDYCGRDLHGNEMLTAWHSFCESLRNGDCNVVHQAESIGTYLGELIAILINIFDSEKVILGGEISHIKDYIYENIKNVIDGKCFLYGQRSIDISFDLESEHTINAGLADMIFGKCF